MLYYPQVQLMSLTHLQNLVHQLVPWMIKHMRSTVGEKLNDTPSTAKTEQIEIDKLKAHEYKGSLSQPSKGS